MELAISIVIVIGLSLLLAWLSVRAWRARRPLVKWPGSIAAGLLAIIGMGIAAAAMLGVYRVYRPSAEGAQEPAPQLAVAGSVEQVARGERLANLCIGCHASSPGLPLDGGAENDLAGMGTLVAPNLTPDGPLRTWSDGEIVRAIRQGLHRDGRTLLLMPSDQFRHMSDADVQALVAYLRTQPAVNRATPAFEMNLLGAILVGLGIFPRSVQPAIAATIETPSGVTPAYGEYLVTMAGCAACHGEDLRGGTSPFTPIGPDLRAILAQWSSEQFVETMRTGVDPNSNVLDAEIMPWQDFSAAFTDEELKAIHANIRN